MRQAAHHFPRVNFAGAIFFRCVLACLRVCDSGAALFYYFIIIIITIIIIVISIIDIIIMIIIIIIIIIVVVVAAVAVAVAVVIVVIIVPLQSNKEYHAETRFAFHSGRRAAFPFFGRGRGGVGRGMGRSN